MSVAVDYFCNTAIFQFIFKGSCLFAKAQLFQFMVLSLLGIHDRPMDVDEKEWQQSSGCIYEAIPSPGCYFFIRTGMDISTVFSVMPYRSLWGSLAWQYGLAFRVVSDDFFPDYRPERNTRVQIDRILYTLMISSGLVCIIASSK